MTSSPACSCSSSSPLSSSCVLLQKVGVKEILAKATGSKVVEDGTASSLVLPLLLLLLLALETGRGFLSAIFLASLVVVLLDGGPSSFFVALGRRFLRLANLKREWKMEECKRKISFGIPYLTVQHSLTPPLLAFAYLSACPTLSRACMVDNSSH